MSGMGENPGFVLGLDKLNTPGQPGGQADGPIAPVRCVSDGHGHDCPLFGECAFMSMWTQARDAVSSVYDSTTFQDLIDAHKAASENYVASYCI